MKTIHDDAGRVQAIICDIPSREDRLATFEARADRIRELKDELRQLVPSRRGDILEMSKWGYPQREIARVCGLSQMEISRVLNPAPKPGRAPMKVKPLRRNK